MGSMLNNDECERDARGSTRVNNALKLPVCAVVV
jgi:hypothetical protein